MKVRYTPRAIADLESIYAYIYSRNPAAALRVRDGIERAISELADIPDKGTLTDEGDARTLFIGQYPYRLYYRLAADEVMILHVRHTSRRPLTSGEL